MSLLVSRPPSLQTTVTSEIKYSLPKILYAAAVAKPAPAKSFTRFFERATTIKIAFNVHHPLDGRIGKMNSVAGRRKKCKKENGIYEFLTAFVQQQHECSGLQERNHKFLPSKRA